MLFNATNIHIAVNGTWLEDAASITWQQQGGVEPLFGYADDRFRAVARNTSIVAGTIGIYYKSHDKFFRSMYQTSAAATAAFRQAQDRARHEVDAAVNAGELVTLLANLDLNSDAYILYSKAAFEKFNMPAPKSDFVQKRDISKDSDPVGIAGYAESQKQPASRDAYGNAFPGSRIDIYYGDTVVDKEQETLYGVWIIGRSRTPIENSPRQGAEPLMEFYSFIARHIDRP